MTQNAIVKPLPDDDFRQYCLHLAQQIDATNIKYDLAAIPLRGGLLIYSHLQYSITFRRPPVLIDVSRYRDGQNTSRHAPEFQNFPPDLAFAGLNVLLVEDCADDGDTAHETKNKIENAGAALVHTAVAILKPNNMKVGGWEPEYVGWRDEAGNVFWEFSGEIHEREFQATKAKQAEPADQT